MQIPVSSTQKKSKQPECYPNSSTLSLSQPHYKSKSHPSNNKRASAHLQKRQMKIGLLTFLWNTNLTKTWNKNKTALSTMLQKQRHHYTEHQQWRTARAPHFNTPCNKETTTVPRTELNWVCRAARHNDASSSSIRCSVLEFLLNTHKFLCCKRRRWKLQIVKLIARITNILADL